MGWMTGNGPLGREPAGRFNFEVPKPGMAMYIEPSPKRIRVRHAGETIADSRAVAMVHESGHQPVYYFPRSDVRAEFLADSERRTRCPKKGEAYYHTIRVGEAVLEAAAWYYPEPLPGAEGIRDMIAFYWDRVDAWYEEDEQVFVHPRDPYHRIDVRRSDRLVQVSLDGTALAESRRPLALFESNLPTRWYLTREEVVIGVEPSDTVTACPYKGTAGYLSVRMPDGSLSKDLLWSYEEPLAEVAAIAGLVCFFNERVDISLDGVMEVRPESPWSSGVRSQNLPQSLTRG